jgi:hypothetical protein
MDEEVLAGGVANAGGVVRVGDDVLRPAGAHTQTVHALLRHVRANGFEGVPEPRGLAPDGRERLGFIAGDVAIVPYPAWVQTDVALASMAELLRRFHDATATFVPPAGATWDTGIGGASDGAIIGHNDVCLENVVFRNGDAVAFLDFDFAAPSTRAQDIGHFARMCVPMHTVDDAARFGWAPFDAFTRLRLVADSYGLPPNRREMLDAIGATVAQSGAFVRERVERGEPGFVDMWNRMGGQAYFDRRREWFDRNRPRFLDSLG